MSNDGNRMRAGSLIFFRKKEASEIWMKAQRVEVVAGNQVTPDAFVAALVTDAHRREAVRQESGENVVAVAVVFVSEIGLQRVIGAAMRRAIDFHELFGVRHRQ